MAAATVTPPPDVLGKNTRPPARCAARWQTLSTPVTWETSAEAGKSPSSCDSSWAE